MAFPALRSARYFPGGSSVTSVNVNLDGVAASPAIGSFRFNVSAILSGVSATPAIGSVRVSGSFTLSGVSASPAVGTVGFNGSTPLTGVSASPAIGVGTVTIASASAVIVSLVGVVADAQIGSGTVTIEEAVVTPPDQGLVAGGGRWYGLPEDAKVYLTGVSATPEVGKVTPLNDAAGAFERYMAPVRCHVPVEVTAKMPPGMRRLFKKVEKPIPSAVYVYPAPFPKLRSTVGSVTTKSHYEEIDEELIAMIDLL